jgi:sialate O-acetylesterase
VFKKLLLYFFSVILFYPALLFAQLSVAPSFSSNMVLQRNQPIRVWGRGLPGSSLTVTLKNELTRITVQPDSTWEVAFTSLPASTTAIFLQVQSPSQLIRFENILIGDVWICIGQSNMEWPMQREEHWLQEKEEANQPLIRFLNPPPAGRNVYNSSFTDSILKRLHPASFYDWNNWTVASASSLVNMSAVAYYFGKTLIKETGVPIGLIHLAIGGAPLESFIDTKALQANPQFSKKINGDWRINEALPVWIRVRGKQNLDSVPYLYGDQWGPHHAYKPGFAYTSGIAPLQKHAIAGVLLYQGESNAEEEARVAEYGDLCILLINSYRQYWNNARLPFYWVQLSSIQRPLWPYFRDEQRKLLTRVPYTGMAVTSDIGNRTDVHPRNKKTVGERLARWALRDVYHQSIEVSGPLPIRANYKNQKTIVYFSHAQGLRSADNKLLREFSIDSITTLPVQVRRKKIILETPQKPLIIYYGYRPFSEGNLINKQGLPATTFKINVH